jgi:hypothetical protein
MEPSVTARLLTLTLMLVLLPAPTPVQADTSSEKRPKMILGWLESIRLQQTGMRIKTKLDPGAKTSSLQATNIERFKKNSQEWVRFDFTGVDLDTDKEETHRLEGPLVREVVIKRHGAPNVTRHVVALEFCLFHQIYRAEFSLTDRDKFNYAILLGRSFLAKVALVDSSEIFLSRPACEGNVQVEETTD